MDTVPSSLRCQGVSMIRADIEHFLTLVSGSVEVLYRYCILLSLKPEPRRRVGPTADAEIKDQSVENPELKGFHFKA